ncbi:MAG: hypothetical protein IPG50_13840 [Myxococcales bacterium]|nr:hypothetical protein [Myxococcales bacterium]
MSFTLLFRSTADVDSPHWREVVVQPLDEEAAPDTVRSYGLPDIAPSERGSPSLSDEEPATLRADEIRAIAPRSERTFDPAHYVLEVDQVAQPPRPASGAVAASSVDAGPDAPHGSGDRLRDLVQRLSDAVERLVAA